MEGGKVLLLSDSNGRDMFSLLRHSLQGQYSVFSFIKPNAKLKDVVYSVGELACNFNRHDYVLVIGGTNDVTGESKLKYQTSIAEAVDTLMPIACKTNLIVTEIPRNYFLRMSKTIKEANKFYRSTIDKKNKNFENEVGFLKLDRLFRRSDFTRHGLHMNMRGKLKLAMTVASFIWQLKIAKCEALFFGKFFVTKYSALGEFNKAEEVKRDSRRNRKKSSKAVKKANKNLKTGTALKNTKTLKLLIKETNKTNNLENHVLTNSFSANQVTKSNHLSNGKHEHSCEGIKFVLNCANNFGNLDEPSIDKIYNNFAMNLNDIEEMQDSLYCLHGVIDVIDTIYIILSNCEEMLTKCKSDNYTKITSDIVSKITIVKLDIYPHCVQHIVEIKEVLDKVGSVCIKSSENGILSQKIDNKRTVNEDKLVDSSKINKTNNCSRRCKMKRRPSSAKCDMKLEQKTSIDRIYSPDSCTYNIIKVVDVLNKFKSGSTKNNEATKENKHFILSKSNETNNGSQENINKIDDSKANDTETSKKSATECCTTFQIDVNNNQHNNPQDYVEAVSQKNLSKSDEIILILTKELIEMCALQLEDENEMQSESIQMSSVHQCLYDVLDVVNVIHELQSNLETTFDLNWCYNEEESCKNSSNTIKPELRILEILNLGTPVSPKITNAETTDNGSNTLINSETTDLELRSDCTYELCPVEVSTNEGMVNDIESDLNICCTKQSIFEFIGIDKASSGDTNELDKVSLTHLSDNKNYDDAFYENLHPFITATDSTSIECVTTS